METESESQPAPPLRHTLQTWKGMVWNSGQPCKRYPEIGPTFEDIRSREKKLLPNEFLNLIEEEERLFQTSVNANDLEPKNRSSKTKLLNLIESFVRRNKIPLLDPTDFTKYSYCNNITLAKRIQLNIATCTRKNVTMDTLKKICRLRKRIDIEQAAGLIVAFLGPEIGSQLIPYLSEIIFESCMWSTDSELQGPSKNPGRKPYEDVLNDKWDRFVETLTGILTWQHRISVPEDPIELMKILERIRRRRPKDLSRTLRIQSSVYEYLGLEPPEVCEEELLTDKLGHVRWINGAPAPEDAIILAPKHFSLLEKMLQKTQGKKDPTSVLRRKIEQLNNEVIFGVPPRRRRHEIEISNDPISTTNDPLALAFSFIALQRRLQLKVVSDMGWTTFLKQGEGRKVWQNDWGILTSFELKLYELATAPTRNEAEIDWKCLKVIATPQGHSCYEYDEEIGTFFKNDSLLTNCCLLMEAYVKVHGSGQMQNLVCTVGVSGNQRGPVDQYNMLCTILKELKDRILEEDQHSASTRENLPGPCYKFLAKDIMHWNKAYKDDAFADGRVPGWFPWLEKRRQEGCYDCSPLNFDKERNFFLLKSN